MAEKKVPISYFVEQLEAALDRKDGYIMCATGQNPRKWAESSWWFHQYDGDKKALKQALYWREHAARVWDCNGLAEGIYKDYTGIDINTKARYNYAQWCDPKGTGLIPAEYRVPGAAVFWGDKAADITHVAYLKKPVDGQAVSFAEQLQHFHRGEISAPFPAGNGFVGRAQLLGQLLLGEALLLAPLGT